MMDKPIRTNNWAVYTINGKIDEDAQQLVFGGISCRYFYFDNFGCGLKRTKPV